MYSQFNLVKNGTVSEECLPYSSNNGTNTESCPLKCKNGDYLVFYHAKKCLYDRRRLYPRKLL